VIIWTLHEIPTIRGTPNACTTNVEINDQTVTFIFSENETKFRPTFNPLTAKFDPKIWGATFDIFTA